jgi:hypothetical protein
MVLPKDFRRGMSVNGAGGRSLGITGRSLHDVLEDTVMAVAQLQGREAKSVKPHADSKRRKVGFVPPAASPTPPMPTILQNAGSTYGPMLRAVLESQSEERHRLQWLIAAICNSEAPCTLANTATATENVPGQTLDGASLPPHSSSKPSTCALAFAAVRHSKAHDCGAGGTCAMQASQHFEASTGEYSKDTICQHGNIASIAATPGRFLLHDGGGVKSAPATIKALKQAATRETTQTSTKRVGKELVRQLDMVLPKEFRRGMSVNGAGGRSLGITGRSLHDVLEDTVMAVARLRGREAKSVKPHADSRRRRISSAQPAAPSSSKPTTSALQAGSVYGPMLRAVLESESASEDRSRLQGLIAASSCSSFSIRPTSMDCTRDRLMPEGFTVGVNTIAPCPSTLMLGQTVTLESNVNPPACAAAAAAAAASCGNSSLYLPPLTLPSIHQLMQDQQHLHDKLMLEGVLSGLPTPTIKPQPLTGLYEKPLIPNYLLQNYFLFSQNLC